MKNELKVDEYVTSINYNFEAITCLINDFMYDFEAQALAGRDCRKSTCSIRLLMIQKLITKMNEDWKGLYEESEWGVY